MAPENRPPRKRKGPAAAEDMDQRPSNVASGGRKRKVDDTKHQMKPAGSTASQGHPAADSERLGSQMITHAAAHRRQSPQTAERQRHHSQSLHPPQGPVHRSRRPSNNASDALSHQPRSSRSGNRSAPQRTMLQRGSSGQVRVRVRLT